MEAQKEKYKFFLFSSCWDSTDLKNLWTCENISTQNPRMSLQMSLRKNVQTDGRLKVRMYAHTWMISWPSVMAGFVTTDIRWI